MLRRQKLFYASGMISLILLPLLCLRYVARDLRMQRGYALEVTMPEKKDVPSILGILPTNPHRIFLRGNDDDDIKLIYIRTLIREAAACKEFPALEVSFTSKTKYRAIVMLFDMCIAEHVSNYFLCCDKFFIFCRERIHEAGSNFKMFGCGTSSVHIVDPALTATNALRKIEFRQVLLPVILFSVLVGLLIWKIRVVNVHTTKTRMYKMFEPPSDNQL